MFKFSVKTLAHALCNACPLAVLYFAHQPSVRDVLQRLDQDPLGIKVLYWGKDQMAVDDIVTDGAMLTVTTAVWQHSQPQALPAARHPCALSALRL